MMFFASLILFQCFAILVVADQTKMVALTPCNGFGNGWSAYDEAVVFDTGQAFQRLDIRSEEFLLFAGDIRSKAEHHCRNRVRTFVDFGNNFKSYHSPMCTTEAIFLVRIALESRRCWTSQDLVGFAVVVMNFDTKLDSFRALESRQSAGVIISFVPHQHVEFIFLLEPLSSRSDARDFSESDRELSRHGSLGAPRL